MGAILVTDEVARTIQAGDHGTDVRRRSAPRACGSITSCSALADPMLLAYVRETGAWFGEQLQGIADRTGRVRAIRGTGLMWGMDVHEPAAGNHRARILARAARW
jgi:acetylornithine/N-succinyldiaminopimelate aminotransferase